MQKFKYLFISCMLIFSCSLSTQALDLKSHWQQTRAPHYVAPKPKEVRLAEQLFEQHFNNNWDSELTQAWAQLGFELIENTLNKRKVIIIQENSDNPRGHGFFVFFTEDYTPSALQIPHGYSDLYTGTIGLRLFAEGRYQAIALNTAHRKKADMAHFHSSYFNAFSHAFARTHRNGRMIQLHGFAQQKRRSTKAKSAHLIISAGSHSPTSHVYAISNCSKHWLQQGVRIYPEEVKELGGTLNVNGAIMRLQGHDGFIHIEMSKPLRNRLRKTPAQRVLFNHCLIEGIQ